MNVYNPSLHTPLNKPLGLPGGMPADGRSMYYDELLHQHRPYASRSEVLAYLDTVQKRMFLDVVYIQENEFIEEYAFIGGYDLENLIKRSSAVNSTWESVEAAIVGIPERLRLGKTVNILQPDGSIKEYWWKEGVADNQLIEKSPFLLSSLPAVAPSELVITEGIATIDCNGNYFTSSRLLVDKSENLVFTLRIVNAQGGVTGHLTIRQEIAGTVIITLPENSAGKLVVFEEAVAKLYIYGETNENHTLSFEYVNGTFELFTNLYRRRS